MAICRYYPGNSRKNLEGGDYDMKNTQKENRPAGTETVTSIITATTKMIASFDMFVKGESRLLEQASEITNSDVRRYAVIVGIIVAGVFGILMSLALFVRMVF